jgi:hypothetical protein
VRALALGQQQLGLLRARQRLARVGRGEGAGGEAQASTSPSSPRRIRTVTALAMPMVSPVRPRTVMRTRSLPAVGMEWK